MRYNSDVQYIKIDGRANLRIPSVFSKIGPELIEARKLLKPKNFINKVLSDIEKSQLKPKHVGTQSVSSVLRNVILNLVDKHKGDTRIHFTSAEMSILLHIFFHLTGSHSSCMQATEFTDFLYTNFGMTHTYSLSGLYRAATRLARIPNKLGITAYGFLLFMSYMLRGTLRERARLAFCVMDIDGDGIVRNSEFKKFLKNSYDNSVAAANAELDPGEPLRDTIRYIRATLVKDKSPGATLHAFVSMVEAKPWIIESLLPALPQELNNIVFQSIFTSNVFVPSLEKDFHTSYRRKISLRNSLK